MGFEVPIIILTIAITIYFLCKWILTKLNFGNDKNIKYLAIIPTIMLTPIVYVGLIYFWIFSISYYPINHFDKQTWESNPEERYKISENIIESKILIGKTKHEIVLLLGNDYYSYSKNHIAYGLGFVPGLFKIDPAVLDVYFENEKVIKVGQHET